MKENNTLTIKMILPNQNWLIPCQLTQLTADLSILGSGIHHKRRVWKIWKVCGRYGEDVEGIGLLITSYVIILWRPVVFIFLFNNKKVIIIIFL